MNRLRASGGYPGYPVSKLDLNTVKTLIKFPNVVFRNGERSRADASSP